MLRRDRLFRLLFTDLVRLRGYQVDEFYVKRTVRSVQHQTHELSSPTQHSMIKSRVSFAHATSFGSSSVHRTSVSDAHREGRSTVREAFSPWIIFATVAFGSERSSSDGGRPLCPSLSDMCAWLGVCDRGRGEGGIWAHSRSVVRISRARCAPPRNRTCCILRPPCPRYAKHENSSYR